MMIDEYLDYIQEGYISTDKTIAVDLDKFESGESNILLIDGISGAGKTTLGKKLAKKYRCKYFESDFPCLSNQDKKDPIECFEENYRKIKRSGRRYIIEGVLVHYSCLDGWNKKLRPFFNEIKHDPIIIVGASVLKAMYRHYRQASDINFRKFIKMFLKYGWYYKEEMGPYQFFIKKRTSVKGSNIKNYKL